MSYLVPILVGLGFYTAAWLASAKQASKTYKYIDEVFLTHTSRHADALKGDADEQFLEFVSHEIALMEIGRASGGPHKGKPSAKTVVCATQELCDYGYYMHWSEGVGFNVLKSPLKGVELRNECLRAEQVYASIGEPIDCSED